MCLYGHVSVACVGPYKSLIHRAILLCVFTTGLDAAGQPFEDNDSALQFDPTDAQFDDVIHSDVESLSVIPAIGFGTWKEVT